MDRICAECDHKLPPDSYTAAQWYKGPGLSRCVGCVHGRRVDNAYLALTDSGRYNDASQAAFTGVSLDHPFSTGAFRNVAKGKYTEGARKGEDCVCKWFKAGSVFEDDFFELDIKAVDKAVEIINRFNQLHVVNRQIKMNIPEVWSVSRCNIQSFRDVKTLQEPFIENYRKFNSNTGWNNSSIAWGRVMQALSHFSYHVTGGKYVLCDLQGGIYPHEVILSDPVILSRTRQFGVTDLGPEGISTFFREHFCNEFCRPHWARPARTCQHFEPRMSTSMLKHSVSVAPSRRGQKHVPMPVVGEEEVDKDPRY